MNQSAVHEDEGAELASSKGEALTGLRVLVTRSRHQASSLTSQLQQVGCDVFESPVIQIQALSEERKLKQLDDVLRSLAQYDRLIVTSTNGAHALLRRMSELNISLGSLTPLAIETIGPKTAAVLQEAGIHVEPIPQVYQAEGLLEVLLPKLASHERMIICRSDLARNIIPETLKAHGHHVTAVDVYETVRCDDRAEETVVLLKQGMIDVITFTSSSTVQHLMEIIRQQGEEPQRLLRDVRTVCIGPITAQTLSSYGLVVTLMAKQATIEAMVAEIVAQFE